MPEFATYADLRGFSQNFDQTLVLKQAASSTSGKTVFLSHSSKDQHLLPGVIAVLEAHKGRVYIDKLDATQPNEANRDTAQALRGRIGVCRRFVMFVTPNSKDSRWIPWELGLADGEKQETSIALFPSAENAQETRWAKREYLGLYHRIAWGKLKGYSKEVWMVWNHEENTAAELSKWLGGG